MKRMRTFKKNNKNTIVKLLIIVFFCIFINALILFNVYSRKMSDSVIILVNEKLDKVLYQFFNELITDEIINNNTVNELLKITKNNKDEILTVNYDIEKTYSILTKVSNVLKNSINNLENGQIDVTMYDKYLENNHNGLLLNVPFYLKSNNIFLNNLGPKIPVLINFNETLLTNVKTKVTNYGVNNALLEIYITVELKKLIITPIKKDEDVFKYDILIGALVVNGKVPEFYGSSYENSSNLFNVPLN